jgi:hypothetical protein
MVFPAETGAINSEEIAKMVDGIPEFKFSDEELSRCRDNKGLVPKLSNWFEPKNEKGMMDEQRIYGIESSEEYKKWGLGKYIKEEATWKERLHAIPYFLDPDARAMLTEWKENGQFEEKFGRLHEMGVSANVVRLLTHENAPACRDFALATIKFIPEFSSKELFNIMPRMEDGNDMAQFWTIAPYIYEGLRTDRLETGQMVNDREDYFRVLMWLVRRVKTGHFASNARYPGVAEIDSGYVEASCLYLARDGNHPVHKYVEKIGKHLAMYLEKIPVNEGLVKNAKIVREK